MDSRHDFLESVIAKGATAEMANAMQWMTEFLAEMAKQGVIDLDTGLRLSLLAARWLCERQKEAS